MLSQDASNEKPSHVIVLGCGRSGTSIFGELFQHIAGYTYHSEPAFSVLREIDYGSPVAIKVPRPEQGAAVSPGLPFLVDDLLGVVPEPRTLFWQVRHPLDTICSLKVGISQDWGHHPRPPDWRDWQSKPLHLQCAHHWVHINTVGYGSVEHLVSVNRFEDMIRDPVGCAVRTCRFIDLDPAECSEELNVWARRVQDENNEDFDEAECSKPYSRPDHEKKVERWRENLTSAEISELVPLVHEAAAQFGYDLDSV